MIVVLRFPDLAIGAFDLEQFVGDPAGQRVLAWSFESRQVDSRLDQRADRPHRIDRPIEAREPGLTPTDQRLHFAGFRVGDDHGRLNVIRALAPGELLERIVHGSLGLHLQNRIEAGKDPQSFFGQVFVAIVFAQLTLDQIEERREGAVGEGPGLGHTQWHFLRSGNHFRRRDALLLEQIEHQVATFHSTLRITTRVIERRPFDQTDQHRHLMDLQFGERLAEEILTGQTKTVNGTLAVLPDEHFVEIGLEDFLLAVMNLQQDRHHGLGQLAGQAALVGQVEVLDQLLGQRTAALPHLPLRAVDPDRPGDGFG